MAESTELARTRVTTKLGVVTAIVLDRVSPDRIALMLIRGSASARYARIPDQTQLVTREIKNLLVDPVPED